MNQNRQRAGRVAKVVGDEWETFVEKHHTEALRLGIVSGPVQHNEPHGKLIHGRWEMVKPGVADYTGTLYNGHGTSLASEAKNYRDRLPRNKISKQQQEHLNDVVRGGGLSFLLVRIRTATETVDAAIPWQSVPWVVERTAESLTIDEIRPWKIQGSCYLDPYCPVRGKPVVSTPRRIFPRE